MVTNIHEHKRYYYTFDNSLIFTESIQNTTQIFPRQIITSGFFRVSTGALGIMQYVYALVNPGVYRLNYSRDTPREVPVRGCDIVTIREYNDDSSHLIYINKY